MKIIFLDIDGVLNGFDAYDWDLESKALFSQRCVRLFNCIVAYTGAKVVVSSSWRHLVHNGYYTIRGFEHMLQTHGIRCEVIDVTVKELEDDGTPEWDWDRGKEIQAWLSGKYADIESYVVIDDMSDATMAKMPFVHTDGRRGLTQENARQAIEILGAYPEYNGVIEARKEQA